MPSGTAQWALSLIAHAAIGTALIVLRPPSKEVPTTFVSMADEKTEKPKPPPPPPAPPQDGPPTTKVAPAPARAPARAKPDAAPAAENATGSGPDLDLGLSNEGGPGGLSVPPGGGRRTVRSFQQASRKAASARCGAERVMRRPHVQAQGAQRQPTRSPLAQPV